jgi:TonB family protein
MGRENRLSIVLGFALLISRPFHSDCLAPDSNEPTHPQKVYKVSSDVTPPELLPLDFTTTPRSDCQQVESGEVQLSLIVDDSGKPRNAYFVRALGSSLDRLALGVLVADRFNPGKHDGVPVAVAMLIKLKLEGCVVVEKSASGIENLHVRLKSEPAQTLSPEKDVPSNLILDDNRPLDKGFSSGLGGGVSAPIPLITPDAKFPSDKKLRKTGICLISLTVDANGIPQSPRVVRSLSPEMDKQALEAVDQYRFKPATKNGQPMPVMMTIVVKFRQ